MLEGPAEDRDPVFGSVAKNDLSYPRRNTPDAHAVRTRTSFTTTQSALAPRTGPGILPLPCSRVMGDVVGILRSSRARPRLKNRKRAAPSGRFIDELGTSPRIASSPLDDTLQHDPQGRHVPRSAPDRVGRDRHERLGPRSIQSRADLVACRRARRPGEALDLGAPPGARIPGPIPVARSCPADRSARISVQKVHLGPGPKRGQEPFPGKGS
jgi:hypothetical protein